MKERKTTNIKINPDLWEEVKIYSIKQKTDISTWLEEIIKKELEKEVKKIHFLENKKKGRDI